MTIEDQYTLAKNTLSGRLFAPYQREGVLWMLTMENQTSGPKGGFLCDEMGLGKTVQILATMLGNPKTRTLLVFLGITIAGITVSLIVAFLFKEGHEIIFEDDKENE